MPTGLTLREAYNKEVSTKQVSSNVTSAQINKIYHLKKWVDKTVNPGFLQIVKVKAEGAGEYTFRYCVKQLKASYEPNKINYMERVRLQYKLHLAAATKAQDP